MAAAVLASTFVGLWSTPAQADADLCVVSGHFDVEGRMGYPTMHPPALASFELVVTAGGCVGQTPQVAGALFGHCGLAFGYGTTESGHQFLLTWVGTQIVIHEEAWGTFTLVEQPLYPLCVSGAAHTFTIVGAYNENHLL